MFDNDRIRTNVSRDYAKAVTSKGSCGCCGSETVQKGVAVKLAGYTDQELAALPPDAVVNSFGCGNPLAFSAVQEGQTVLDLGSGAGIDLLLAAGKVGPNGRVIGVDMTDEMIARARENIAVSKLRNIDVRKGIIEELPVDSESVDWVISNCVINLSPEKSRVFREIHRVLKQGGTMMVSDIVAERLPREVLESPVLYSSCVAGAVSEKEYVAGLQEAGLVDVKVLGRIFYDENQLEEVILSELENTEQSQCSGGSSNAAARRIALDLKGKIWSLKVTARKPLLQ